MRFFTLLFILTALAIEATAHAQEVCRFTKVDIPRDEARLLELASVVEFRCASVLPLLGDGESQFIVERYQDGPCVSRQIFSLGKYDGTSKENYKGTISFGWQINNQKLVGVHDTGYFRLTDSANLPGFGLSTPIVWSFFKEAQAERRTTKRGQQVDLYPIIGIRGSKDRTLKGIHLGGRIGDISSLPQETLTDFFKKQPDAIIVYLAFGTGMPDLDYDKPKAEQDAAANP